MGESVAVIHIVSESTTPDQRETVAALVSASNQIGRQLILEARGGGTLWNVKEAPGFSPRNSDLAPPADLIGTETVLQFWSVPRPLSSAVLREFDRVPRILDWDASRPLKTIRGCDFAGVTVDSVRAVRALARIGVDPARAAVIRASVDFARLRPERRAEIRGRLGLTDAPAVLIAQPMIRRMAPFSAAWAGLLVERVMPGLQIVVTGSGNEVRRIERLCTTIGRDSRLFVADDTFALPELLLAVDIAVFTPPGLAPLRPAAWSLAAGCPLVATATHANCELLAHGLNARLARDPTPRLIARRILETLEAGNKTREQAAHGRGQAYALFSRQRMIEQYRCVYRNALTDRPVSTGIEDALSATRV